jgi:hypothetical protein
MVCIGAPCLSRCTPHQWCVMRYTIFRSSGFMAFWRYSSPAARSSKSLICEETLSSRQRHDHKSPSNAEEGLLVHFENSQSSWQQNVFQTSFSSKPLYGIATPIPQECPLEWRSQNGSSSAFHGRYLIMGICSQRPEDTYSCNVQISISEQRNDPKLSPAIDTMVKYPIPWFVRFIIARNIVKMEITWRWSRLFKNAKVHGSI